MPGPSRSRPRKIGSRSCDACKIRKVKCTEIPPCKRCVANGVDCTFDKTPLTRGPRTLRTKTLQQIQQAQQRNHEKNSTAPSMQGVVEAGLEAGAGAKTPPGTQRKHHTPHRQRNIAVEPLVLRLCIYRLRLFPVWPIVAVEEVIAALQRDVDDMETYALAVAVSAATMAQLGLDRFKDGGLDNDTNAASLEAECQRTRRDLDSETANLNTLRTSFFLHTYHENQVPGGTKSLLYLRETITLAQILGLHRASSYTALPPAEDRLRRRILWLLFVTERGVAALHTLPVILTSAEKLPPLDVSGSDEEAHVLPAFKKLVNLFWTFDQFHAFEILQDAVEDADGEGTPNIPEIPRHEVLNALQKQLQDAPLELDHGGNDVQKADICVTRQWMQVLVWRASWRATLRNWRASGVLSTRLVAGPVQIAQEFLDRISQFPSAALEAHGPAIEFKVYEIASAVADSFADYLDLPDNSVVDVRRNDVLMKLQRILATSRGGNSSLLSLLASRIAQVTPLAYSMTAFDLGAPTAQIVEEITDENTQNWASNSSPAEFGQSMQTRVPSRHATSSPWLSLVTAAGFEQQSISYDADGTNNASGASPGAENHGTSVIGGYSHQSLCLPGQMYDIDILAGQASSDGEAPSAGDPSFVGEMLAHQSWLLGLGSSTRSW